MNFPFFIARRYLFSKKSTNAINIISAISMVGVAVATMALVIVLSVFNGFHDLVASFFTNFDPQIEVLPTRGKSAPADDPALTTIKAMPEVLVATECVADQALAYYNGRQAMVYVMASTTILHSSPISTAFYMGRASFAYRLPTYSMACQAYAWPKPSTSVHSGMAFSPSLPRSARVSSWIWPARPMAL